MRYCKKCDLSKEEIEFSPSQLKQKSGLCRSCAIAKSKKWAQENPEKYAASQKKWKKVNPEKAAAGKKKWANENPEKVIVSGKKYIENNLEKIRANQKKRRQENPEKEKLKLKNKKYRQENPEKIAAYGKIYKQKNKEKENIKQKKYKKDKYHSDPIFRNRVIASRRVNEMLKSQGSFKNGKSCLDYFPWTPEELWAHLLECMKQSGNEWMTPNNQGTYDSSTWDDNDQKTWTWQLDHIIPQSDLPYSSMKEENFRKCWALSNLRPLSAKQNLLDGVRRIRHLRINQ